MTNSHRWQVRIQNAMSAIPRSKYPVIIELAGMPRLGKTTIADSLIDLLKRSGFKARLSSHATHSSPIDDRWSFDFSAWTLFAFLKGYLELRHSDTDFLVADRGLFDAITWLCLKAQDSCYDTSTLSAMTIVARSDPWLSSLCVVLAFLGDANIIFRRLQERKLYKGESLVTTERTLSRLSTTIKSEEKSWNAERNIVELFHVQDEGIRKSSIRATEVVVSSLERFAEM